MNKNKYQCTNNNKMKNLGEGGGEICAYFFYSILNSSPSPNSINKDAAFNAA